MASDRYYTLICDEPPKKLAKTLHTELSKHNSALARRIGGHRLQDVLSFVDQADFSGFGSIELHELVQAHGGTRWHSARFGVPLPVRSDPVVPELVAEEGEQRYVSQLLMAYQERHHEVFVPQTAARDTKVGPHFLRQRVSFYSAESLRVFARESVPQRTFEALQEEILEGVIDVHDNHHGDGLDKLTSVTQSAQQLAITANALLPRVKVRDRGGICHQLVNEKKLSWCNADTE